MNSDYLWFREIIRSWRLIRSFWFFLIHYNFKPAIILKEMRVIPTTQNDNLIDLSLFKSHLTKYSSHTTLHGWLTVLYLGIYHFLVQENPPPYFLHGGPDYSSGLKHHLLFPGQHPQSEHPLLCVVSVIWGLSLGATSLLRFFISN